MTAELSDWERRQARLAFEETAGRVKVALGRSRSLKGVLAAVEEAGDLLAEKVEETPPRFPLGCEPKCVYCCSAFVEVPPSEVVAIVHFLRATVPPGRVVELTRRIAKTDERTRGLSPAARTDARIPCPLLVDGLCAVYAVRPLKCRGYNSYSKRSCRADWDGSARNPVSVYRWGHLMADVLVQALDTTMAEAGLESMGLDLVAALRLALEDKRLVDRWLAGERVFAAAKTAPSPSR